MAIFIFKSIVQVVFIGLIAFAGPGIFNAMQGLGAAGSGDPKTSAIANGCLYGLFAITGYLSGPLFNMMGPKLCMILGGLSYALYAICMYFSTAGLWAPAIGGLILGCGAGIFWTAQSGLMLGYATEGEKGKFAGLFWSIFQLGGVLGGIITLGINWKRFDIDHGGLYKLGGAKASPASYFTFVGIMAAGTLISVFALMPPKKVVKSDGSSPVIEEKTLPVMEEVAAAFKAFKEPFVWKMLMYFFYSNWYYTFQFGALNGMMFNSRSAGLNSALYFISDVAAAQVMGKMCDWKTWSPKKRGKVCFFFVCGWFSLTWALSIATMYSCANGKVDKPNGIHDTVMSDTDGGKGSLPIYQVVNGKINTAVVDHVKGSGDSVKRDQTAFFPGDQTIINPWDGTTPLHFSDGCDFLDLLYCTAHNDQAYCSHVWTAHGATGPKYLSNKECMEANTDVKNAKCLWNVMTCATGDRYGRGFLDISMSNAAICDLFQTEVCVSFKPDNYKKETALAIITYMVSGANDGLINTFLLWLIGMNAGKSVDLSVKYYAVFKGTQNIGACIAWLSDLSPNFLYRYQTFVNVGMGVIALGGAFFSLSGIPDSDTDLDKEEENIANAEEKEESLESSESE